MRAAAIVAALVCALACGLGARFARAASPGVALPPLVGQVVDPAGQLGAGDARRLDAELESLRARTGHAIVVLILPTLAGESIDDVAYRAFNTWGVGGAGRNDGVLIVVATGERAIRIETGKGVGGALTDLQSNDIIRQQIGPAVARGQLYAGLDAGVQAIAAALARDDALAPTTRPARATRSDSPTSLVMLAIVGVVAVIALGAAVSPRFRAVVWPLLRVLGAILRILTMFSGGGGGGRGGRYRGGGGRSGGGGSSDRY